MSSLFNTLFQNTSPFMGGYSNAGSRIPSSSISSGFGGSGASQNLMAMLMLDIFTSQLGHTTKTTTTPAAQNVMKQINNTYSQYSKLTSTINNIIRTNPSPLGQTGNNTTVDVINSVFPNSHTTYSLYSTTTNGQQVFFRPARY